MRLLGKCVQFRGILFGIRSKYLTLEVSITIYSISLVLYKNEVQYTIELH